MVQPTHRYRSHNNIFRRVAIYDLNRFVGNPHIGTKLSAASFPNAWIPVRLSTATDAILLRSHEANGAAVGWLPWVREELCVSCRLDCRAGPSLESFPPGSVRPLATMGGALLMSGCSHALRLEPDGGEASASPTSGDTSVIHLRLANILACYTAAN